MAKGKSKQPRKFNTKAGKSPKLRHAMKRAAEENVRKDKSRIKEPRHSVRELLDEKG